MTGIPVHCAHCNGPIGGNAVWLGSFPYHEECTRGPTYHANYYRDMGCMPYVPLTEDRVRQIVREELRAITRAAAGKP